MSAGKELFELESDEADLPRIVDADGDVDFGGERPAPSAAAPTVVFSVGELTTYAVAVVVLVVAAYLIGAYIGRERSSVPVVEPPMNVVPASESLLPVGSGEAREEPTREPLPGSVSRQAEEPAARPAPQPYVAAESRYTLEAIRFTAEDRAVALIHVERLQKLGYIPTFLMQKDGEVGVCVGKFANRSDKTGVRWRDEIRSIRPAYRHCEFVRLR